MLVNLGVTILGILVFLFIFWKRLKEDYSSEVIFQTAAYILIGVGVAWLLSVNFFPNWFFWVSVGGGMVGLSLAVLRSRIRFYETLEAFIIASLPWLALVFLGDSVANSSLSSFLAFLGILTMVFVAYYLDLHYKSFTWYRSGRIGFAGVATAGLIFLVRSVLAMTKVSMLSLVGRSEAAVSGVMAFICFLLLYNLGMEQK